MSLFGSLFSGVSGLTAQSQSMGMISDNVSNVNTVAYKGAIAQFSSLVARQIGVETFSPGGVRAGTTYRIGEQGLIQNSNSATDAAIDGRGFFVVNGRADASAEQLYTRAGSFRPDFLGNMRNAAGFFLQGWRLDSNEQIINPNQLETVNVRLNAAASPTTQVEIGANLEAGQAAFAGAYAAGDMATYASSGGVSGVEPHFSRAVQVYDALGSPHNLTMAFLRDAAVNTWSVEIYGDTSELDAGDHPDGLVASGQVTFNGDGTLQGSSITPTYPGGAAVGAPLGANWANGAIDSSIDLNLGSANLADGLTQFDADYDVAFTTQDGASVGQLNAISIDEEGFVTASFTNGQNEKLYQLPIATFANPLALDPRTGNVYAETNASGTFNLHLSGSGGAGDIAPSALEAANVDIADEFTKLIVTQRAYSANARIITTADEMLDELIRISR